MTYRTGERRSIDTETVALRELVARMRRLRARVALPFLVACAIVGQCGILTHALGYWSVFGVGSDGSYFVSGFTIAAAFVLPAAPLAALGWPTYVLFRARLRRAWSDEYGGKHRLSPEWLESTKNRFL